MAASKGKLWLEAVSEEDPGLADYAAIALTFIRLHAEDLQFMLSQFNLTSTIRNTSQDVCLSFYPLEATRTGEIFLALLRVYFSEVKPKPTGVLTLSGVITKVSHALEKTLEALKQGAEKVLVPLLNKGDVDPHLLPEEQARVRYMDTVLDVLEEAVEGYSRKPDHLSWLLRNLDADVNPCTIGHCLAPILVLETFFVAVGQQGAREAKEPPIEGEERQDKVMYRRTFAEAASVPCAPRKEGRLTLPSYSSMTKRLRTAAMHAYNFVKHHEQEISTILHQRPCAIDLDRLWDRTNKHAVDITINAPPHANSAFLSCAMVIAIIQMAWRLPYRMEGCGVLGNFDSGGRLYGWPCMSMPYLKGLREQEGIRKLFLWSRNVQHIQDKLRVEEGKELAVFLEELGLELIGIDSVFELIQKARLV